MIDGKTKLVGVMGCPIHHSLSPQIHNYWFNQLALNGVYLPLPVVPEKFDSVLKALPDMGFVGANITLPFKEVAFQSVHDVDIFAQQTGSVNAIDVLEDGRLFGFNTDAYGFIENIRSKIPQKQTMDNTALVLGAGGASRAVIVALSHNRVNKILIANRSPSRADRLAADFHDILPSSIEVIPWESKEDALKNVDILVNTTSLGMQGQPPLGIDLSALPIHALVTDIVYTPLDTDLLLQAQKNGNPIVDGIGMLFYQAQLSFERWFGIKPPVDQNLRNFIFKFLGIVA